MDSSIGSKRPPILTRETSLVDVLDEVVAVGAVSGPNKNRLVVLVDPSVVQAYRYAVLRLRGVEVGLTERVPRLADDLYRLIVVLGKRQLRHHR